MIGKDELVNFKKMWTWLSGYPAHDREYYMKNVVRLDDTWLRSCPLANSADEDCDGCRLLWNNENGTLCTDTDSPVYKWKHTSRHQPDDRCYYASHTAVMAMNALREMGVNPDASHTPISDYIHSQLHG
jgi:hypothetical protein